MTLKASSEATFPFLDLGIGLLALHAVMLLKLSDQLVPMAGNLFDFVVRKLTPFLLDAALELLPVALNLIPVHEYLRLVYGQHTD